MSATIALDAMGGDFAPANPVAGAILAARELGIRIVLVGRQETIERELSRSAAEGLPLSVVHASEAVAMDESPAAALRRKKDSSLRIAANLVQEGKADALVSAGNSGAVMATAMFVLGTVEGVDRPALAAVVPNLRGVSVWLDVGANVDSKPQHIFQWAVMAHIYAKNILSIDSPRVGLLSIGEEAGKGNDLVKETFKLLKESRLNFIGNVEGHDIFNGNADVIVCDGFTGNVSLKVIESAMETLFHFLKQEFSRSWRTRLGYLLSRPAFKAFKRRVDYAEFGGVPLLGVKGATIISHGRSSPRAIRNAIRVADEVVRNRVNEQIHDQIRESQRGFQSVTA
ncbi:MAG TPA: phosphate acyltransferase PlsX [Candidatus Polarisedimenticolia bacterium]|nr:phosphate acyltransferase PlsX [Candidatus Polarisedimenticolia bacterium]